MNFALFLFYLSQKLDKNYFILSNRKNLDQNNLMFSSKDEMEERKQSVLIYLLKLNNFSL